jgi:non-specific serine/threonine protein kinase
VLSWALLWLGTHHLVEGHVSLARDCLEHSRALYTSMPDRGGISNALDKLGNVARALGDRASARQLFEENLALSQAMGDKHGIAFSLQALGELSEEEGKTAQALACYAGALPAYRDVPDRERAVTVLRGIAALSLAGGEPARALRLAGAVAAAQALSGQLWRLDIAVQQKMAPAPSWEQIRDGAQQALGPQAAAAAWAEGQAQSLEQAIAYALEGLGDG